MHKMLQSIVGYLRLPTSQNYSDPVLFCLSGDEILQALENGVSQWPKLEGRFPQVGEIKINVLVVVT